MTYAEALPYIQCAVTYTIGWWFGRARGKANAAAEAERLRKLANEALQLAKQSQTVKLTNGLWQAIRNSNNSSSQ
ncbi:MAG: hypothetical protein ACRYFV_01660 [Janthinobacterium lividum]